jgi:hypothetical protein
MIYPKDYLLLTRLTNQLDSEKQTIGRMIAVVNNKQVFACFTLELPDKNNQRKISCIQKGTYKVVTRESEKYGDHFYLKDVPGRDYILIHSGNYVSHTEGCILVGRKLTDLNNDGLRDVTSSKETLKILYDLMPDSFTIIIN